MPRTTSRTSAPTASQTLAMALTKETLVARNAFDAYLMVSAEAGSVTITGAWMPSKREATRPAVAWSSQPITMRSGWRKSWTAEPSRRNSGFDATFTSSRLRACSTTRVEPTGTVDLLTTTHSAGSTFATADAAWRMKLRSAEPSAPWGVGTQR